MEGLHLLYDQGLSNRQRTVRRDPIGQPQKLRVHTITPCNPIDCLPRLYNMNFHIQSPYHVIFGKLMRGSYHAFFYPV